MINAVVWSVSCVATVFAGLVSEMIIQRGWCSRTTSRKIFAGCSNLGAAVGLVAIPFVGCNFEAVFGVLVLSNFFIGLDSGGCSPVPSEMTRNFPATLFAIINSVNCSWGFLVPNIAGAILDSDWSDSLIVKWSYCFYLAAAACGVGSLTFLTLGDATYQKWDMVDKLTSNEPGPSTSVTESEREEENILIRSASHANYQSVNNNRNNITT